MINQKENTDYTGRQTEHHRDGHYKEVIAFANPDGAVTYIGIDEQNNLSGIENISAAYDRLTKDIRDVIQPEAAMFVRYLSQDHQTMRIEVGQGGYKPGEQTANSPMAFNRHLTAGSAGFQHFPNQQMTGLFSDSTMFEMMPSPVQNLTFNTAAITFQRDGIEFSPEKYALLGLIENHAYTNLALLLSDQCPYTIKVAVFKDEQCTEFRDSREFGGSLFKQFEDAVNYLALCNKTVSSIQGILRTDKQDYPQEAIREALLNAIIHRDYAFSGSIIINVSDSKMEIISLGGLVPGLSKADLQVSISQSRNKKLAEIFHRLRLVESYGTGIRRIFRLYENCPSQPEIEVAANAFKVTLPNQNAIVETETAPVSTESEMPSQTTQKNMSSKPKDHKEVKKKKERTQPAPTTEGDGTITPQMQTVMDYLAKYGEISEPELQNLLDVKRTRAYLVARQLIDAGKMQVIGRGVNKKYVPAD